MPQRLQRPRKQGGGGSRRRQVFDAWSQKDWNAVLERYSREFYAKTGKDRWRTAILGVQETLGDQVGHELVNWQYGGMSPINGAADR